MSDNGIRIRYIDGASPDNSVHTLSSDGFVYITGGDLVVESCQRLFQCSAGHLLFIPRGTGYRVRHCSGLQAMEISFCDDDLRDASFPMLHGKEVVQHAFWFQDAALMGALMMKMEEAASNGESRLLRSGMDLLLCMLGTSANETEDVTDRFLKMVFDHSGPVAGVSDYAARLGVSTGYLNRVVRNKTFRAPMDWVGLSRLGKARDLLRNTRMSMAEVAVAVGIDDQSYFARFFKKMTGMSPREYREGGSAKD